MSGQTTGWVKTIHEQTYGELLGVVIVGPHATDLIGEAVVALDAESTIETVADGVAPHPTLAEGMKEAGLVALGRAIHLPPSGAVVGSGHGDDRRNALMWAIAWWFARRWMRRARDSRPWQLSRPASPRAAGRSRGARRRSSLVGVLAGAFVVWRKLRGGVEGERGVADVLGRYRAAHRAADRHPAAA